MAEFDFFSGFDFGGAEEFDFSLDDIDRAGSDDGIETCRYSRPKMYDNVLGTVEYEHAADMAEEIEFSQGMREFVFVSGNFIFGDLLEALVDAGKIAPKHITIQTLSLSEENIDSSRNLVDLCPYLESIRIILSVYFWGHEHRPGQLVPYLYEQLDLPDIEFDCAFASIHTKIISIETLRGNHIVIDGSANLRSSRNIEQLRIECDDELFNYVEDFSDKIFKAYSVLNKELQRPKPVRGNRLWGAVVDKEEKG